jgi:CubicO group peptidase (beta-lactamase class C family)
MHEQFRQVTIEMLTSHRSGLHCDLPEVLGSAIDGRAGRQLIARRLLSVKPRYGPGNFVFSQWNYVMMGAILESLTGQSFEQLMAEELFKPLGMESCGFGLPTRNDRDLGQPWDHQKLGKEFRAVRADSAAALAPSGSVYCAMADYLKFARAHIDGFRGRDTAILPSASFAKLHEQAPFQHYTYGGWNRIKPGWAAASALHHVGSDLGTFAVVWILPETRFAIIAVTNAGDHDYGYRVTDEVVRSIVQNLLP